MNTSLPRPITIAVLAMGGEGGGVLADWIVALSERNGYYAQTTSVPGVAQRTGATIYYVELFPEEAIARAGRDPVLALMPVPGDVDIALASELMEAGRAVQRGLVTPERTTLIASTHRVYSIGEKVAMGDGMVDGGALIESGDAAAKRFVRFDMQAIAEETGSVVSAVLFGTLAGTGALPFPRAAFERTIEEGGIGVGASLRAFAAGFDRASKPAGTVAAKPDQRVAPSQQPRSPETAALLKRIQTEFPESARSILLHGVRRLIDYQDPAYANQYLDRVTVLVPVDAQPNGRLVQEVARYLALWMSYEDTIRVADLKTRATRFERVRSEVRAKSDQSLRINEFMHPRLQEICDTLPAGLGRWLLQSSVPRRLLERMAAKGRVVQTTSLTGFLLLYFIASLRRWRRRTLRFQAENARIEAWLRQIGAAAQTDYDLAVELAQCQRLVKGYGDTHERGLRNFDTIVSALDRLRAHGEAASKVRALRDAALADEHGHKLQETLARYALG